MVFKLAVLTAALLAGVSAEQALMIPMRDGVKLYTVIDQPIFTSEKTHTAVMDRSPYGTWALEVLGLATGLLEKFVSVRQDQRGTKKSEGNFTTWHNAANDSYDTQQYLVQQSWSNGRFVDIGASADGLAAFASMELKSPWLRGQFIIFASSNGYDVIFPGGAFRKALAEFWIGSTVPNQAASLIKQVKANEAPTSPFWNGLDLFGDDSFKNVAHPSVMWAGWYDIFLVGNLIGFHGYQHLSDPSVRGKSFLVVDPCGHCQDAADTYYKNTLFGRTLLPLLLGYDTLKEDGKDPNVVDPISALIPENVSAVTFYVLGAKEDLAPGGYWTSLPTWPTYTPTNFYLYGNTSLSPHAPSPSDTSSSFKYDPTNPVPSMGGNNLEIKCGPVDQRPVEASSRSDVLSFTSDTLTAPLAITGPLFVDLYVSSSAVDTDFTAKLTDVYTTGESRLIQDGIFRMRWRDRGDTAKNMTVGQTYKIRVGMWNTSYIFGPGHKLRLSISSSNSPRFSPNPNNGWPLSLAYQGPNITAINTLHHNAVHPSALVLPVVTEAQLPETHILQETEERVANAPEGVKERLDHLMESFEADISRRREQFD